MKQAVHRRDIGALETAYQWEGNRLAMKMEDIEVVRMMRDLFGFAHMMTHRLESRHSPHSQPPPILLTCANCRSRTG
jgi:hypothetical protein